METKEIKAPYNVWFISDLHYHHRNIIHHQHERIQAMSLSSKDAIEEHDAWIMDMWHKTVKRGDHVYVLGDMILSDAESTRKALHQFKKNGCILHLITGNHDKNVVKFPDMFNSIDLIKEVTFKANVFPFLKESFRVVMCHYPIMSWQDKCRGVLHCYGHVHSNAPWLDDVDDLMVNVGLDGKLASYSLISLENLYEWYNTKLNGMSPTEYVEWCTNKNKNFLR